MNNKLIILSQHFYPEEGATAQLITELATELAFSDTPLTVLTSAYPNAYEFTDAQVVRLCGDYSSRKESGLLSKLTSGSAFFFRSLFWLVRHTSSRDLLLVVSNPPFIGAIPCLLSLIRSQKYIYLCQDIFPQSAIVSGILPTKGPLVLAFNCLMRAIYHRSEYTIVLSSSMKSFLLSKVSATLPVAVIPNWAIDEDAIYQNQLCTNTLSSHIKDTRTLNVQYSGNFGRLHDIITILEAARILADTNIRFRFIGGGFKKSQIFDYIQKLDLENVEIQGYQEKANLHQSLSSCDVSIVSLIPGAESIVAPSKLYGILNAAKPVIVISSENSELSRFVVDNQLGFAISNGDSFQLASTLKSLAEDREQLELMSRAAKRYYSQFLGKSKSAASYHSIVLSASSESQSS